MQFVDIFKSITMYIHAATCISPQQTFPEINLDVVRPPAGNKLSAIEPKYEGIPLGILRRMGRAVRFGVGAAMPLLQSPTKPNGIVIGTGNGGMEDCIKFLNQIIEYDEGALTPTNFVQSTPNAIAAQLGLMNKNTGYNITHVHRGLAFENALLDAQMLLKENPRHTYLLGGVEEISSYNYNIENLGGWYKKEPVSDEDLYTTGTPGSIAGEGAALFEVNNESQNAIARVKSFSAFHTSDIDEVGRQLQKFLAVLGGEKIDLLLSGENGDIRFTGYSNAVEELLPNTGIARFKHIIGEYPSVSAAALWLACRLLKSRRIPPHMIKKPASPAVNNILIYNHYKGLQHSFMLVSMA